MKNIYIDIMDKLIADVPELFWVDLQKGQMNYARPPILFPAALLKLQITKAQNLNTTKQKCDALITVDLCFDFTGNTDATTPITARNESLKYMDVKEKVFATLQGFKTANMNPLERVNEYETPRPDGYKVTSMTFTTSFLDFPKL